MAQITIEKGKYAGMVILMDDADYPLVEKYRWYIQSIHGLFYAQAKKDGKSIYMHRLITNAPIGLVPDHINFKGLDNRRENLRLVTLAENSRHNSARTKPRSGFRGVYPDGLSGRRGWSARICVNQKKIYIGHYFTEEEAARAYDHAARQLHGDYAILNFPEK